MSTTPPLSPGEVLRAYLDGCADTDSPFDESKLLGIMREHGYSIITTVSVSDWQDGITAAEAERDALKAELAEAMNELDSIYGVLGTADAEGGEPAAHTIDCMQTELVAANARVAELEGALEPMKSGGMAGKWGVIKAHLVIAGFKETAAEITRLQAKVDAALESGARL